MFGISYMKSYIILPNAKTTTILEVNLLSGKLEKNPETVHPWVSLCMSWRSSHIPFEPLPHPAFHFVFIVNSSTFDWFLKGIRVLIETSCQKTPCSHHMVTSVQFSISLSPRQFLNGECVVADGWLEKTKH